MDSSVNEGEDVPERTDPQGGLWGGRFSTGMAPEMEALNRSLDTDYRLLPHDLRGSMAWAESLARAGVITLEEGQEIVEGLGRVESRTKAFDPLDAQDEDVHSLVERLLHEEIGPLAGKLHTGRSRNDQVATDVRLWGMDAAVRLEGHLGRLLASLLSLAEAGLDLILPGYTHLQRAQPIRAAHWVLSHFWPLLRDRARVRQAAESAAILPLGSGALAGCPFPIDRDWLAGELGFREISRNSLDAVADRDWVAEMVFAGALMGTHLSRLGEDLVLFSSSEFSFIRLSDAYSTGSSLMPQKRNPDVAELTRGKSGRLVGNSAAVLTLLKGLPTGYNRDLQEDKDLLFDSVDTLSLVLPAVAGAIASAEFDDDRLSSLRDPAVLATDLAEYLVKRQVPFRQSHEVVGALVKRSEDKGVALSDLPLGVFKEAHPAFDQDVFSLFSWESSVEAREVPGGTARVSVQAQLAEARRSL